MPIRYMLYSQHVIYDLAFLDENDVTFFVTFILKLVS